MEINEKPNSEIPSIRRYAWVLAVAWTAAVAVSLIWNLFEVKYKTLEAARIQARTIYDKDVVYRRWNAVHGGVYVPVTDQTRPNEFLKAPDRDANTTSGQTLTLINPAYMTRMVHEIQEKQYGVRGHITSLNPIRSKNKADAWESLALQEFERGRKEISSVESLGERPYMRLMRPLVTEESCLKCHAAQGYKVGEIRGGISVAIPMEPLWMASNKEILALSIGYGTLWVLGLVGLFLGARRLELRTAERERAEKALQEQYAFLDTLMDTIPNPIFYYDKEGVYAGCNASFEKTFGRARSDMIGRRAQDIVSDEIAAIFHGQDTDVLTGGAQVVYESPVQTVDGKHLDVIFYKAPYGETDGQPTGIVGVIVDITNRKRVEREREKLIEELTKAKEDLYFEATHDRLTALWNRAAILDTLKRELARSSRERTPIAVIIADLDHFKRVNDEHGHLAGDAVLRQVANRLAANIRPYDAVGRYGGEEFINVITGGDQKVAKSIAERLRSAVGDLPLETPEGIFSITMSFGVAALDATQEPDMDSLVRAADEALYQAKKNGRNRVELWSGSNALGHPGD